MRQDGVVLVRYRTAEQVLRHGEQTRLAGVVILCDSEGSAFGFPLLLIDDFAYLGAGAQLSLVE